MTSLAEAESKFGPVVRDAGGAIYGIETTPSVGGRQEEKLRTGTLDGFVKIAVSLNQPNIDAVSSITRNQTRVVIAIHVTRGPTDYKSDGKLLNGCLCVRHVPTRCLFEVWTQGEEVRAVLRQGPVSTEAFNKAKEWFSDCMARFRMRSQLAS